LSAFEGQAPLVSLIRTPRQTIRLKVPCGECAHAGLCAIEEQIEENLVLEIIEIGRPVDLALSCSVFEPAGCDMRPRITWTAERRARFQATMQAKRAK
jgi:hypothetical protein